MAGSPDAALGPTVGIFAQINKNVNRHSLNNDWKALSDPQLELQYSLLNLSSKLHQSRQGRMIVARYVSEARLRAKE